LELHKIKGNTYYINSPTNIGIYVFKNKFCLLIDSGINSSAAKKFDDVLKSNNLHPKYIINTHAHYDHSGGNKYFKDNYSGTLVYSSKKEGVYIQNPELSPIIIFSSSPPKDLYESIKPVTVDFILEYGINKINDEKFEIISLSGHSAEHIGIITPEKVCFLGDSIFSNYTLDKYSLPYLFDIEKTLLSLNTLKDVDADYFLISHGKDVLSKNELLALIDRNISNIETHIDSLLVLLDQPCTREDILQNLIILNDINLNIDSYFIHLASVSAFIAYLLNKNLIQYSIEGGKLYYFKK
jgi:glyoxylase-like metal-dependent hydrolase (beta-lactamase superfamily II)